MHLGIISPFPPEISGVGQYGWHLTRGLAATGHFHTLTVFANHAASAPSDPVPEPVRVVRTWGRDDLRAGGRLLRAVLSHRPDVIWFNAGLTMFGRSRAANFLGLLAACLAQPAGIPVVATLHEVVGPPATALTRLGLQNGRLTHLGASLATRLLLRSHTVCVTLDRNARWLRTAYGARNIHHLPLGAPTPPVPLPRPADAPPLEALCLTSLAPHRGLEVLTTAFREVHARLPAATLTIAGDDHPRFPGYSRHLRTALHGQAGLRWAGAQTEAALTERFAHAQVVVLPYLATTGASSVLYRAAAAGRPVIASDLPDVRATAEEAGLRVRFVTPGDAAGLAQALLSLLADPEQRQALANHNLAQLRRQTPAMLSARYAELLTQAARHGRRG